MPRTLSAIFKRMAFAQETSEAVVVLLTITHPDLPSPIYCARYSMDFTSRGNVYKAFPFEPTLPLDTADELPQATIVIENVDRVIVSTVRTLVGKPAITLEVVVASDPDNPQVVLNLLLNEAKYDALTVTCTMAWESFLGEPYPAHSINPGDFPGVFAMK